MEEDKVKGFIQFQIRRKITNLYKTFLFILEDVKQKDDSNFSEEDYQRNRKRILDHGNDCMREIEEVLEKTDIRIK